MLIQLIIGTLVIAVTVLFHAFACDLIIRKIRYIKRAIRSSLQELKGIWKSLLLTIVVLDIFFIMMVEICIWAFVYMGTGAITNLETALYFSTSSFTTVGYGDVYLDKDWRLLSSIEATNGFIMFGWSTAFIFAIVSKVYQKEGKQLSKN